MTSDSVASFLDFVEVGGELGIWKAVDRPHYILGRQGGPNVTPRRVFSRKDS